LLVFDHIFLLQCRDLEHIFLKKPEPPPPLCPPLGLNIDSCITNSNETNKSKVEIDFDPRSAFAQVES
jgi:hypothetical protein